MSDNSRSRSRSLSGSNGRNRSASPAAKPSSPARDNSRSRSRSRSEGRRPPQSKRSDNAADEKRSILVKSLPYDARVEEVKEIFSRFGEINDVYLPRDFHTRKQRGFGFVEFARREDAEEALEQLNGYKMGDREIQLQIAQNRRKKPEDFRNRRPRRYSRSRSHSRHGHSHSHHHHSHRRSHSDSRRRRY